MDATDQDTLLRVLKSAPWGHPSDALDIANRRGHQGGMVAIALSSILTLSTDIAGGYFKEVTGITIHVAHAHIDARRR
jgi:hypothetical protein